MNIVYEFSELSMFWLTNRHVQCEKLILQIENNYGEVIHVNREVIHVIQIIFSRCYSRYTSIYFNSQYWLNYRFLMTFRGFISLFAFTAIQPDYLFVASPVEK